MPSDKPAEETPKLRKFAGYEIVAAVGTHRGVSTYKATQLTLGRTVLLTVLPPDAVKLSAHRAAFERHLEVASRLRHENVISAIDAGEVKGWRYFVTECVEGPTLANVLETAASDTGALEIPRAVEIARDVAKALGYLDSVGLVHRNVSPSTIVLSDHGSTKLSGFVMAKDARPGGSETWFDHDVSETLYLAPEFLRGERGIDVRADIYSLGCVLFHMLTGQPPFRSRSAAVVLESHATKTPPDPRELRDDLPATLVDVLDRCLRKRREHRYGKADDLVRDLEIVRSGRGAIKGPSEGALWSGRSVLPRMRRKK